MIGSRTGPFRQRRDLLAHTAVPCSTQLRALSTQAEVPPDRINSVVTRREPQPNLCQKLLWLFAFCLACGRTGPAHSWERPQALAPHAEDAGTDAGFDAGPECRRNAQCDIDSICIENKCVFFGECTLDWHCGEPRRCEQNLCTGGNDQEGEPAPPPACEINAECGVGHYCVLGACHRGVECIEHAQCAPGRACLVALCVDAF